MPEQFTSADYATAAEFPEARHDRKLIVAALRIASNVMRPGLIEEACGYSCAPAAAAIRKALTGESV